MVALSVSSNTTATVLAHAGQQGGEIPFLLPYDFDSACVAS